MEDQNPQAIREDRKAEAVSPEKAVHLQKEIPEGRETLVTQEIQETREISKIRVTRVIRETLEILVDLKIDSASQEKEVTLQKDTPKDHKVAVESRTKEVQKAARKTSRKKYSAVRSASKLKTFANSTKPCDSTDSFR